MGLLLSQEVLELAAELEAPMDNEMVFSVLVWPFFKWLLCKKSVK